MYLLYLFALLPCFIGFLLWALRKEVTWWEWVIGSALAFLVAVVVHFTALHALTDDIQSYNGLITHERKFSAWKEYYEYAVYRTESRTRRVWVSGTSGSKYSTGHYETETYTVRVFDHWEPTTCWHNVHYTKYSNIDTEYEVDERAFIDLSIKFKSLDPIPGKRTTSEHNSRMIDGDPNDYVSMNRTNYIEPVTKLEHWSNRIKAGPSTFSFEKIDPGVPVYEWPENPDPFQSQRRLGLLGDITTLALDQMNARLGPIKRVNVIMVGFGNKPMDIAMQQEAKWIGGKKNDLVICVGGVNPKIADWCYVFGWTERTICKKNIETLVIGKPLNNDLLPEIEKEIRTNYIIKDWSKFDYITIYPTSSVYIWYFFSTIFIEIGFYTWAFMNRVDKQGLA